LQNANGQTVGGKPAMNSATLMRAVIADDEEIGRVVLRELLGREADVEIVGEAACAQDAARLIEKQRPDIAFMDIEMPGGNGVELLRGLEAPHPYVVFVTAHPEFSVPAFDVQAVDYLVKPVERKRFAASVKRARQRVAEHRMAGLAIQIVRTSRALNEEDARRMPAPPYSDYMAIRSRRQLFSVNVADIYWVQGASQYSRVHAKGGEYLLSRTLASLECELDPTRFFRIHRSAIVNAAHVREVRSCGDGRYTVQLVGGQMLPMGRARREILEKRLSGIAGSGG
jgi:two-component system LytT family response regulator